MKSSSHSLQTRLLGPLILLLVLLAGMFAYLSWSFHGDYETLRNRVSLNAEVGRHAVEVTRVRSRIQELLHFYRQKQSANAKNELNSLNAIRASHLDRIRWLTQDIPRWKMLGASMAGGIENASFLQDEVMQAIEKRNFGRADEAFRHLSTIFEINSARLKDFTLHLESELRLVEKQMQSLLTQTFWFFIAAMALTFLLLGGIVVFYRRQVLRPLRSLHHGLQSLARGELEAQIPVDSAPREIREMTEDFNQMARRIRKTQNDLTRASQKAHEAARVKADFLANMSHEIRTPLNTIIGLSDELVDSGLSGQQKQYAQILGKSGEVLLNIVNDILDFSKLEAGNIELEQVPFDLHELAQRLSDVVSVTARRKGLHFEFKFTPARPFWVLGDGKRLEQIILNLLGNSVKFTERGLVRFEVEAQLSEGRASVRMTITDTGIGIASANLGTIFERFNQSEASVTRKYGGTGLGLAIVKQLVSLMKGHLSLSSEVGHGTTFKVDLGFPEAEAVMKQPVRRENDLRLVQSGKIRVLLVDDSPDNRYLIQTFLAHTPTEISVAEDGRQAVEAFDQGSFDLVLMDIQMPVLDGYSATTEIREIERKKGLKRTCIIALTAYAMAEDINRTRQAGCDLHMTKPIRKDELLKAVHRVVTPADPSALGARRPHSPF